MDNMQLLERGLHRKQLSNSLRVFNLGFYRLKKMTDYLYFEDIQKNKKVVKGKNIMITVARSGISRAVAALLATDGAQLILCGRRENRLKEFQGQLDTPSHLLVFDVGDRKIVFEKINSLPEAFSSIDILINNSGNDHGLNPVNKANLNDLDAMIDSNIKGLINVIKVVLPAMISIKQDTSSI